MDFAPNLPSPAFDPDPTDLALDLHLNDIVAELRDSWIAAQPDSVLRYALSLGLSGAAGAYLAALLERRIKLGSMP